MSLFGNGWGNPFGSSDDLLKSGWFDLDGFLKI